MGELVDELRFAPIDKDDMCAHYKGLYEKHGVMFKSGIELTGLEREEEGLYAVKTWDHGERADAVFHARAVVIAIGRGVPRRFDIPGNTDGIAYRLTDARHYVGEPACVVGGGTSAAEAVIAISEAKARAGDPCAVYWSYRGDRMPRVSKGLADVFFEAYVGNGNILYFPRSEPAAIVVAEDREEYLAVRVDRRSMQARPNETTYLEFAKTNCIACIGEDIPESLLSSLGIHMRVGGPQRKKRMVVNRFLESELDNVFLVGDLLSQAYFETDDFAADPAGFREIKHRGNIKAALRDGVLVAQVLEQRFAGKQTIEVRIEDADEVEGASATEASVAALSQPVSVSGPPADSMDDDRQLSEAQAFLVRTLPGGVAEQEHPVPEDSVTTIGRAGADLTFPDDTMLSERHASISHDDDGYLLRDDGSHHGTFLRISTQTKRRLETGDLLRAGRQFLLLQGEPGHHYLAHYDATGNEVARYDLNELPKSTVVLGRDAPDITLDRSDQTLSRRQLSLTVEGDQVLVKDLLSVNGTYLRVRGAVPLEHGDQFRVGQQVFAFSLREDAVLDTGHFAAVAEPVVAPGAPAVPESAEPGAATVTFAGDGRALPILPEQTVCDVAEANGVDLVAECHSGICGSDPVRILEGTEHLAGPPDDQERETLEDICELEPGPCRLACMLRATGPVKVEVVK